MKQVRPKKNLGQHFLVDLNIAKRIADTVDEPFADLPVLEVGPGMGVMTQFLTEKPRPLKVVEIDRESVAYLKEKFPEFSGGEEGESRCEEDISRCEVRGARYENTSAAASSGEGNLVPRTSHLVPRKDEPLKDRAIISGDFLRMDLTEVFGGQPFVLTGNYPYDISSQIFFKMLDNKDLIPCCTGMIQHEVAVRMAAQPGNKQYGILSVLIQAWYDVEYLFTVEPGVFNPPPKVQSAVIRMTRNQVTDLGCDWPLFRRVVKTVFNQRRKMLRVSLRQLVDKDASLFLRPSEQASPIVAERTLHASLLTLRPEQLTIPQFVELTNLVAAELSQESK